MATELKFAKTHEWIRPEADGLATVGISAYAVEALTEFGPWRGGWLAMVRLGKCGPWHRGGWDPIPERCGAGDGSLPAGRSEATRESTPQLRSADV